MAPGTAENVRVTVVVERAAWLNRPPVFPLNLTETDVCEGALWGSEKLSSRGEGRQLVAQSVQITALQTPFRALALACFHQVLEAPGALGGGLTAFSAPAISLHAELIFALPRDFQVRELVNNACIRHKV